MSFYFFEQLNGGRCHVILLDRPVLLFCNQVRSRGGRILARGNVLWRNDLTINRALFGYSSLKKLSFKFSSCLVFAVPWLYYANVVH
jgi:hypothetical protein